MAKIRLPRIVANDYEAVRHILKRSLPNSYEAWLNQMAEWRREHAGDTIIDVDVNPHNLADYLARTRHGDNLKTLIDFIADIDTE